MRIVSVALKLGNGLILSLPAPARHHDVIHAGAASSKSLSWRTRLFAAEQGFLTDVGTFVGRAEACVIATAAGQLIRKTEPADELFSEDLW